MSRCACGSYAINIGLHGRVSGKHNDLCDVCYWRTDYARLEQECERLRADKAAIDLLNQYIVTAEHPETGKTAICADSGTLRDCMEAALSAKP